MNKDSTLISITRDIQIENDRVIRKWKPVIDNLRGTEEEFQNKVRNVKLDFILNDNVESPCGIENEESKFRTFMSVYAEYFQLYVDETDYIGMC